MVANFWKTQDSSPVRVDPAGAWLSKQADEYFNNRDILLDHIPREAHWQLSIVEGTIRTYFVRTRRRVSGG